MRLSGGLIALAAEWATAMGWEQQGARWVAQDSTWMFPSGARITFGYAAGGAHRRYLGSDWSMIGVDEAVDVPERAIREVWSRLRRDVPFPRRLILASNPGGPSHDFLVREFVDRGRLVRSFASDNPGIDSDAYLALLRESLTADRFQQLAEGVWEDVWSPGAAWDPEDVRWVDGPGDVSGWVVAVDPSASGGPDADECGIVVAAATAGGLVVTEDLSVRARPSVWWPLVLGRARELGGTVAVEGNLAGVLDVAEADLGEHGWVPVHRVQVSGSKQSRHIPVATRCRSGLVVFDRRLEGSGLVRQMLSWQPGGPRAHGSPDRVDALVVADEWFRSGGGGQMSGFI